MNKINFSGGEVITASEIGQHEYCSTGWYLRKCGHEPKSSKPGVGADAHVDLGKKISGIQRLEKRSRETLRVAYVLILIVMALLMGVFLLSPLF